MQGSTAGCVASLAKTSDTRNLKHGEWFHTFVKIRRLVARLHAGVYGGVGGLPRKEERLSHRRAQRLAIPRFSACNASRQMLRIVV